MWYNTHNSIKTHESAIDKGVGKNIYVQFDVDLLKDKGLSNKVYYIDRMKEA